MKCLVALGLLATLTTVLCQDGQPPLAITKPRPVGVIYLIQLLNQPIVPTNEYDEVANVIPNDYPYKNSKLLYALTPNTYEQEKDISREKRSPTYGKGGGGCSRCGGGGGGGYPGGGGGYGGGGGGGGSWSSSSSQASSGSWGSGGGKGGYHG